MSERKGRLSFCFSCKKDTETVIRGGTGFLDWLFRFKIRICKSCGKEKPYSELEEE